VPPDDDKPYAIETCRSSESVLKSDLKINDIQLANFNARLLNKNLFSPKYLKYGLPADIC